MISLMGEMSHLEVAAEQEETLSCTASPYSPGFVKSSSPALSKPRQRERKLEGGPVCGQYLSME
jgi:hypothetical protein